MGRPSKTTAAKRNRERALQMKQQEKQEKKAYRKIQNEEQRPTTLEGEDPDLAGLHVGPQPPPFD
ncbi:hypothetical protein [Candidatus Nitronereus thalassa]|uniref:Small EDRK-rich factor-like N-terminal domain-containing protein n=1 Tax=Candidatus Nitronereus thalassa TaxID=3020898 RepID=A0ABU3K4V6_9BACT|nr:hypothetical protein [Candidatus Nitronereus thalassa]MDT7041426.1 hypothetical protein [Candidatus Nitronereus thalassa]